MKKYREITPLQSKDVFGIFAYPDAGFDYPLHSHLEYELNMIYRGSGNRVIGDKVDKYEEVDLVLLGSNLAHSWDNSDTDKSINPKTGVIFIQFEDKLFNHFFTKEAFHPIKIMLRYAARGIEFQGETRTKAMKWMKELTNMKGFEACLHFFSLLNFLALSDEKRLIASAGYSTQIVMKENKRIDEIYQYMRDNFHRQISVKEVASIANMSVSAFSHFFKKSTNRSFIKFLTEIRLSNACQLLSTTQLSVNEIASQCGYTNISNFNRLFKKYKQATPMQFRNILDYAIPEFEARFIQE